MGSDWLEVYKQIFYTQKSNHNKFGAANNIPSKSHITYSFLVHNPSIPVYSHSLRGTTSNANYCVVTRGEGMLMSIHHDAGVEMWWRNFSVSRGKWICRVKQRGMFNVWAYWSLTWYRSPFLTVNGVPLIYLALSNFLYDFELNYTVWPPMFGRAHFLGRQHTYNVNKSKYKIFILCYIVGSITIVFKIILI